MGGSVISTNLYLACESYKNIIDIIVSDNIFLPTNNKLPKIVESYINFYDKYNKTNSADCVIPMDNHDLNLVESIHKLYPIMYHNKEMITVQWLVNACTYQYNYFNNISVLINNEFNPKEWIKSYLHLLKSCRKNPTMEIVSTFQQDFVWRAHMQDNKAYITDTIKYLGDILHYDIAFNKLYSESKSSDSDKEVMYDSINSDSES